VTVAAKAALLALAVIGAYVASLAATFQFDDYNVIVGNPAVQSWDALAHELGRGLRPVLKLTYTLDWTLWGGSPVPFHALNVALHALNACLLYFIALRLAARWNREASFAALLAALLFALHPVQTEAVTYASGRSVSLAASFYLGALLVYLRAGPAWASLGLFALACGSRETALTLPAALLLCELARRGAPDWRAIARRQWPYWTLAVLLAAAAFAHGRYVRFIETAFAQRSVADNLLTQVQGIGYLVSRLFLPHRLNIDPALPALAVWDTALALQALGLGVLALVGLLSLRKAPWIGFGLCWFFLQLAPTNSVMPRLDVANERQLYLALWGLGVALAFQVAWNRVLKTAAAAALLLLAALGVMRQLDYRSETSLWEAAVREAPWNARAHNNLGYARAVAGDHAGAVRAYREALAFSPGNETALYNLARSAAALRGR